MRNRPKYVLKLTTRHGKTAYYYRPGRNSAKIRLPDEYGSEEFWASLRKLQSGGAVTPTARREQANVKAIRKSLVSLLHTTRNQAKARGMEFTLSFDWAMDRAKEQNFKCALTGTVFNSAWKSKSRANPFVPSIDRIDCARGYTPDNVRLVICAINLMMMDWGEDLFSVVASRYIGRKKTRASMLLPEIPCYYPENNPDISNGCDGQSTSWCGQEKCHDD